MEKDGDKIEIKLNSPKNAYFSGQEIIGQICFSLTKKTKIRAISIHVVGKGKWKWMEMFRKDAWGTIDTKHVFYTGKEVYVNHRFNCAMIPARGIELAAGASEIGFAYTLSEHLPSSIKGKYGSIKYKLKITIQKPWTFDDKYTIPLTIVKHVVSPPPTVLNPSEREVRQTTRNVSLFTSGPISLVAELSSSVVIRNKKVTLHVTVDNRSSVHVDKLRFTIIQKIDYCSTKPITNFKREDVVIFTKETGGVEKKSERTFAHDLLIPPCPPTVKTPLFYLFYSIKVEAILPAFYKNLSLSFPIQVFSNDGSREVGNPFEEDEESRDSTFPICNQLSSSIDTSSPAHSQTQIESESSSLYSTTSESSTATLSPAPRNSEINSLNRISVRSSLRNSIGYQYPNLTGQGLDIHSGLPDSNPTLNNIHAPPAMNHSYPPPNITTFPHYLQSSVRFEVQARYPINELPPSYEELFGSVISSSATAPSVEPPV